MGLFDNLFDDIIDSSEDSTLLEDNEVVKEFVLLDEAVLKKDDSELKVVIEVHGGDNRFRNKPYMKISKSSSGWKKSKAKDRTRISIENPEYIDHDSDPGTWRLNSKDKKKFIEDLQKPYKDTGRTVWEEIKRQAVEDYNADRSILKLQMPDYTQL